MTENGERTGKESVSYVCCYELENDEAMLLTSLGRHLNRFLVDEYPSQWLNVHGGVVEEGAGFASPMSDVLLFCCCYSSLV
jgi:hypothetical protein